MTIRGLSELVLMWSLTLPLLIMGCSHSQVMSPETSLLAQPVFNASGSSLDVPSETPHASNAIAQSTEPSVVLISSPPDTKNMDCGVVEVDKDGKPIPPPSEVEKKAGGRIHWPCQKVANGSGGYMCNAMTLGRSGCNNCPSCSCQNVGSGSSQNCVCQ